MAVPTVLADLDPVLANNVPAGSEAVFPNLDNYLRAHAGFIAQLRDYDITNRQKLFPVYSVTTYGADKTGVASSTAAIQAAIDAAEAAGGGTVLFDAGEYLCGPITINSKGVKLVGQGGAFFSASGITQSTLITYNGAGGGTMLTLTSVDGASENKVTDCAIDGIAFDGNTSAAKGVVVRSVNNCRFNFAVKGCTTVQVEFNTVVDLADSASPQHNQIEYIRVLATGSQNGILIDTDTLDSNFSKNNIGYLYAQHDDGYGIRLGNCDNNVFLALTTIRASGGTGYGLIMAEGNGTTTLACRENLLFNVAVLDSDGAPPGGDDDLWQVEGTGSYPSVDNTVYLVDSGNNSCVPTVTGTAEITYGTTRGVMGMQGHWYAGFSSSHTNARLARTQAIATEVPAYFVCANGKAIALSNSTGTAIYGINVNATSNSLRFTRTGAANNRIELDTAFFTNAADDAAAATAGVEVGELYRTGSTLKIRVA